MNKLLQLKFLSLFKLAVFISTFVLLTSHVYSQPDAPLRRGASEATLSAVVQPSPNNALLTRMISDNVDPYTGILNVNIPLYTLKSYNIELPISVQGNINAHKVNDIGSWVGLGWRLNAGGAITRVMKNLPDEFYGTISPSFNFLGRGYFNLASIVVPGALHPVQVPYQPYSYTQMIDIVHKGSWNTKTNPPSEGYDLQPDEFYFNFGKYSGKFVFDMFGNINLITDGNFVITPTIVSNNITKFTVKTDDGYTYEFSEIETSKLKVQTKSILYAYSTNLCTRPAVVNDNGQSVAVTEYMYDQRYTPALGSHNGTGTSQNSYAVRDFLEISHPYNNSSNEYPTYNSSWYLTKITSPTNDNITLTYADNGILTYTADREYNESSLRGLSNYFNSNQWSCSQYPIFSTGFLVAPQYATNIGWYQYPSYEDQTWSKSTIDLHSKRIQKIETANGNSIEFIANTSRFDFTGDKRLDKIVVKNGSTFIKEFEFNYANVYNGDPFEVWNYTLLRPFFNFSNYQMIGVSLQQFAETVTNDPSSSDVRYRMYLTSIQEKGSSNQQIPPYQFTYNNQAGMPFRTSYAKDKYGFADDNGNPDNPSSARLVAGVLNKIVYPTGGYKEFIFELSGDANTWNGLRIKEVKEYESTTSQPIVKTYSYGTFRATDVAYRSYYMPDAVVSYQNNGTKYAVVQRKLLSSWGRVNPEMNTHGASGGYSFTEVSQNNGSVYRIEFTDASQYPDQHNITYLVSAYINGNIENANVTKDIWYPFPQLNSNDWQRGLPLNEYWRKTDATVTPSVIRNIKSKHYDYDFTSNADGSGQSYGLQVTKYRIDYGISWNWMLYGRYEFRPKWQLLKSVKEKDYAPDGVTYIENSTKLGYEKIQFNGKTYVFLQQKTQEKNSLGEQLVERYRYTLDYLNLGSASGYGIYNLKNKNIYSAVIEKYQYLQDQSGNNKRYIGGILNEYDGQEPVIRAISSYQPTTGNTSFNESNTNTGFFDHDPNYKAIVQFPKYDSKGNILEQAKISDLTESYIWDYQSSYPIAKVTNATTQQIAYTSFEADGLGGWTINPGSIILGGGGVTGKKKFSGVLRKTSLPTGNYTVSLWSIYYANATVNGQPGTALITNGNWRLYEWKLINVNSIEIAADNIDEVRLFPSTAQMTTYTFDPLVGMTSQCDANNRIIYYEYDGLQRLKLIKDQFGNIIKTYEYNYKQ